MMWPIGVAGVWAHGLALAIGSPARPAALLVAVAAALIIAVAMAVPADTGVGAARPLARYDTGLRARARRTGVLRQRDPDARGRRRPRAPTPRLSAA